MKITKKSKSNPQLSAKTGPVGGKIPAAKTGQIGPDLVGANTAKFDGPGITAKTTPYEMGITARLRGAMKAKEEAQAPRKLEAEVSLGPTEVSQERQGFLTRIKKKGK